MGDNSFAGINFDDNESKQIFETHQQTLCDEYKVINDSTFTVNLKITKYNGVYILDGTYQGYSMEQLFVKYSAASPPTYNSNFSGSGLPFPTEDIAFDNTPNKGVAEIVNGKFSFSMKYPNSYYINMGTVYIPPHVKLVIVNKDNIKVGDIQQVNLGEGIPFRTLTWPVQRKWSNGPLFYENKDLPVRTQYEILLASAYPDKNVMPKNFWGAAPSH